MIRIQRKRNILKILSVFVAFSFFTSAVFPAYLQASEVVLPAPTQSVPLSSPYSFPVLKGLNFNPANPLEMEFIIDTANEKTVNEDEASSLIRYFLAGLTIPEQDIWVNLSPIEKDRVITDNLSQTDLGKDLLSEDYLLKQISSSLTHPETEVGKAFWTQTYAKVQEVAQTTKVPVNTFNKIWIVPDKAEIYENETTVLVSNASLKAMLEEDYLALKDNISQIQSQKKDLKEDLINKINNVSSGVVRELILPKINQEVNAGKNFATLRQIYYSLILAVWFKQKFKDSIYQAYINKGKLKGIDLNDKGAKDKIYNLYVQAFTKGVYNYIKTDYDKASNKRLKRQYFSGGFTLTGGSQGLNFITHKPLDHQQAFNPEIKGNAVSVKIATEPIRKDDGRFSSPVTVSVHYTNLFDTSKKVFIRIPEYSGMPAFIFSREPDLTGAPGWAKHFSYKALGAFGKTLQRIDFYFKDEIGEVRLSDPEHIIPLSSEEVKDLRKTFSFSYNRQNHKIECRLPQKLIDSLFPTDESRLVKADLFDYSLEFVSQFSSSPVKTVFLPFDSKKGKIVGTFYEKDRTKHTVGYVDLDINDSEIKPLLAYAGISGAVKSARLLFSGEGKGRTPLPLIDIVAADGKHYRIVAEEGQLMPGYLNGIYKFYSNVEGFNNFKSKTITTWSIPSNPPTAISFDVKMPLQKTSSPVTLKENDVKNILNRVDDNVIAALQAVEQAEDILRQAPLDTLLMVTAPIYSKLVGEMENTEHLLVVESMVLRRKFQLLNEFIFMRQGELSRGVTAQASDVVNVIQGIREDTFNNAQFLERIEKKLEKADVSALILIVLPIYNNLMDVQSTFSSDAIQMQIWRQQYNVLNKIINKKKQAAEAGLTARGDDVLAALERITQDRALALRGFENLAVELQKAPLSTLQLVEAPIGSRLKELMDEKLNLPTDAKTTKLRYQYNLLNKAIVKKREVSSPVQYASWKEFEEKELAGKVISQKKLNLAVPQKIAFNIDIFAQDRNVVLYDNLSRVFGNIFKLLDGNPNFAPVAIFLGDYAQGMPSSAERLAEFLKSNPALGNAKYKVNLVGNNLYINGNEIALFSSLAEPKTLKQLDIDFLVEATRQRYLDISDIAERTKAKEEEEGAQHARLRSYWETSKDIKIVVIPAEEDLNTTSVVNRINAGDHLTRDTKAIVMAKPATAVANAMTKVAEDAVKAVNAKTKISVVSTEAIRTDRQGNNLIDTLPIKPGEGANHRVIDTAVMKGANAISVILRVDGYMTELTPEMINKAFLEASKGALKGVVDFKAEDIASNTEANNQALFVLMPKYTEVKTVRQSAGAPYRTVVIRGFYNETGYTKSILDLITEMSLFNGNKASVKEASSLEAPKGTIPVTKEKVRFQAVEDGKAIPVVLNSMGRVGKNVVYAFWNDPNFRIVAINAVRSKAEDIIATLLEYDVVFGEAPFSVETTSDRKNFKFTDKEEKVVLMNDETTLGMSFEDGGVRKILMATPYGNLAIEEKERKIVSLKLHGEDVLKMNVAKNEDNTFVIGGRLANGTTVRLTYAAQEGQAYLSLISAGVKKQIVIPITNIRAEKSVYTQEKGEPNDVFLKRVQEANRELGRKMIVELPQVNEDTLVFETSGQSTEETKLMPFYFAGTGMGLISAPATKSDKLVIPGSIAADATIVPGVNTEALLSVWNKVQTESCASCTTNAAATGIKPLLDLLQVVSGYFDTIHALTNDQGRQYGEPRKSLPRSFDARRTIVPTTTGASSELVKALPVLAGLLSGVSFRVGNDDGSLVYYDLQVDGRIPSVAEINEAVRTLAQTAIKEGGLKGSLGFGEHRTSLEIIGTEFGGIFDPSKTQVNNQTKTISVGIWYDNERGYTSQYIKLALLTGLYQQQVKKDNIDIVAQNVIAQPGASTGNISIASAQKAGATAVVIGLGSFRQMQHAANQERQKPVSVNTEINKAIRKAFETGVKTPILNLYVSEEDQKKGATETVINRQITEALGEITVKKDDKDVVLAALPAEDIMRLTFSLEFANEDNILSDAGAYAENVRTVIAGFVSRKFVENELKKKAVMIEKSGTDGWKKYIAELQKTTGGKGDTEDIILTKYGNILGANVANKVRVILKLNEDRPKFKEAADIDGIDGLVLSPRFWAEAADVATSLSQAITNNPDKIAELQKRVSPRFFIAVNNGSSFMSEEEIKAFKNSGVDSHYVQLALAPALPQIADVAAIQRGESLPKTTLPRASKVPVRVMLQNVVLGYDKEGFIDLDEAVALFGTLQDVLIGHSEVRTLTGISEGEIAKLLFHAHELRKAGKITGNIILAVGDDEAIHESGNSINIVVKKMTDDLSLLSKEDVAKTDIAYEPLWAISTGQGIGKPTATLEQIKPMHKALRSAIKGKFGPETANSVRILYGGSFSLDKKLDPKKEKPDAELILALEDVDGALIGSASMKAENMKGMAEVAERAYEAKKGKYNIHRRIIIAGNHKAMDIKDSYAKFVAALRNVDRNKVEVSLAPEMNRIRELTGVYNQDPTKGIVFIDQLSRQEIQGKTWYLRVDFNVPIDDVNAVPGDPSTWKITSDARLRAALADAEFILKNGGKVVFVTHFEPKGTNLKDPQSVSFMVPYLEKLLSERLGGEKKVAFVSDILGSAKTTAILNNDVVLLENVRLNKDIAKLEKASKDTPEDKNARDKLAAQLYSGPNVGGVVHVGIGVMHRNQGTVTGEVKGLPKLGGIALRQELNFITGAIRNPKRPIAVVFGGGAKIGDKIPMLKNIILNTLDRGDKIFVYGAAAIPFWMVRDPGFEAGLSRSLVTEETLAKAQEIMEIVEEEGVEIVLPVDFIVADGIPTDESQIVSTKVAKKIPVNKGAYDIGPETVKKFEAEMMTPEGKSKFGTIIQNGPAGVFEVPEFMKGTQGVNDIIAKATAAGGVSILGGGETGLAAEATGITDKVSFISKGGGATLEMLEGKDLPGIETLRNNAGVYSYHLNPTIEKGFMAIRDLVSDYASRNADLATSSPVAQNVSPVQLLKTAVARQVFDSRGFPTVETEVILPDGKTIRVIVPSGASTGEAEALELRDGGKDYKGKGVTKAVSNAQDIIIPALTKALNNGEFTIFEQRKIDTFLNKLDGDEKNLKRNLGANAILAVSLLAARIGAYLEGYGDAEFYKYINKIFGTKDPRIPIALMNVLNGGKHAPDGPDIQEFMIGAVSAKTMVEQMKMTTEVFHTYGDLLKNDEKSLRKKYGNEAYEKYNLSKILGRTITGSLGTAYGDEGGYVPAFVNNREPFLAITAAIRLAGYNKDDNIDVALGMDGALSEWDEGPASDGKYRVYHFKKSLVLADGTVLGKRLENGKWEITSLDLIRFYKDLILDTDHVAYLFSIEDGLGEKDWKGAKEPAYGWETLTKEIGPDFAEQLPFYAQLSALLRENYGITLNGLQVVTDDPTATNPALTKKAISFRIANALLDKLNQIGTLTEAADAGNLALEVLWNLFVSHRSGESEDTTIADFSVGLGGGFIKTGAPNRTDRIAKYNQLLRIEENMQIAVSSAVTPEQAQELEQRLVAVEGNINNLLNELRLSLQTAKELKNQIYGFEVERQKNKIDLATSKGGLDYVQNLRNRIQEISGRIEQESALLPKKIERINAVNAKIDALKREKDEISTALLEHYKPAPEPIGLTRLKKAIDDAISAIKKEMDGELKLNEEIESREVLKWLQKNIDADYLRTYEIKEWNQLYKHITTETSDSLRLKFSNDTLFLAIAFIEKARAKVSASPASSPVTPESIRQLAKAALEEMDSLTKLVEVKPQPKVEKNPGGIDLQGINVKTTPSSVPMNMPLVDMENFEGLTFRIVRMEEIKDINVVFAEKPKELALAK